VPVKNDHQAARLGGRRRPGSEPKIEYGDQPRTTISDLIREGCDFTGVPVVAGILRCDQRTVRRRIADGVIPAVRIGAEYRIPVAWLAEQAGLAA